MNAITRRSFLKTAAVAGSGLVFGANLVRAQQNKDEVLDIALIGFGAQGRVLFESIMKLPNLRFRAICDLRPAQRRYVRLWVKKTLKQDVTEYVDFNEMIAKEHTENVKNGKKGLDGVFIATPDFWHSPMTCACLEAGINVYCEKMMSDTKEGARKMVKAMQKSGKLLQIGHQRKSNPRYIYAREKLIKGAEICGQLTNANGQWNRAVTTDLTCPKKLELPKEVLEKYGYKDMHQFLNWRWYKGLGRGPISDLGAHQMDIFGWFFDARPKSIMASGSVDFYKDKDWYDNVMCIIQYDTFQKRNARVFYQVLTTTSAGGGYFEQFMGTDGAVKMSENPALTKIYKENGADKAKWDSYVANGLIQKSADPAPSKTAIADARESKALDTYAMPDNLFPTDPTDPSKSAPIHLPHVLNFLDSIRGKAKLTCDGAHAFEAEAAVFKAVDAIEAKKELYFEESDFVA